jgi:hypothetical protein
MGTTKDTINTLREMQAEEFLIVLLHMRDDSASEWQAMQASLLFI